MFPESFAEKWLQKLEHPKSVVLDPFCGRGTLPFQASLMGMAAIGNDVNPVAYCLTRAKTNAPGLPTVLRRITILEETFHADWSGKRRPILPDFFKYAYQPQTLRQILFLRETLMWDRSDTDCMIAALTLGALHGESERSPSYLSNQMPRTISTKPAYSIRFWQKRGLTAPKRDVFDLLRSQSRRRYKLGRPDEKATVLLGDMRDLPRRSNDLPGPIALVITSPPYLDITSFEEDQWLRLWFLGGPPRPTSGIVSRDDRHGTPDAYWRMIADMWRSLGQVLDSPSNVVIRIGAREMTPEQMIDGLLGTSVVTKRDVRIQHHETSDIKGSQIRSFRPGAKGCMREVDCHFSMA
jgi:hypothetical protein